MERLQLKVRGTVQGVGFRPYVYGLARELSLKGFVTNTSEGVTIEVEGEETSSFVHRLSREAPPLAAINEVDITPMPFRGYDDFEILQSADGGSFTLISPDVSICPDCHAELMDQSDRRYRYPFINCTNCGPRYTITRKVPYDRPNTTMAVFRMCPACEREYNDPVDRRFHAQPNACPECGPDVSLSVSDKDYAGSDAIDETVRLLRNGAIVAIKGLGGYHLACDATMEDVVNKMRERKRRNNKPFAVMAGNVDTIRKYCTMSESEEALLVSPKRPIVLLRKRIDCNLPQSLAPGVKDLGFMLPYTPLHYLIMEGLEVAVMTSGNLTEEPIQVDNEGAVSKLEGIADAFLTHNRDIFMRVDDSVIKYRGAMRFVRRARGFTPEPVKLAGEGPDVLAAGADIKNTFTLLKGPYAIVSQHIGDMETFETLSFFEETLSNLKAVYRAEPEALAYDLHPGYMSTNWALKQDIRKLGVQHHHAHIASVMAEKGLSGKVLGVAFDGTGYGVDGTLWGGEFLVADAREFKRAGHFRSVPLPGGERAVREPWRVALSYIHSTVGPQEAGVYAERLGFYERYGQENVKDVLKLIEIPEVSPLSSGAGRLFDAVSAMLDICSINTFEGEAAMALETAAAGDRVDVYPADIRFDDPMEVDFSFSILGIMNDFMKGTGVDVIAARFHNAVVEAALRVVLKLSQLNKITTVSLSGGAFQNDYLLGRLKAGLEYEGLDVFTNERVPVNDGGISLGQAFILREKLKAGEID